MGGSVDRYAALVPLVRSLPRSAGGDRLADLLLPRLTRIWLYDYRPGPDSEIVETRQAGFSYLFDIGLERLISAWGVSRGRSGEKRDKSRMQGFPLGNGALYDRGHAIPHTLGGPTDINLVPQLATVNRRDFRPLEKLAVATPGSLYFTHWIYPPGSVAWKDGRHQLPVAVDQGLLIAGETPDIRHHRNRPG